MDPVTASAALSAVGQLMGGLFGFGASRARARQLQREAQQSRAEASIAASVMADEAERAAAEGAVQGGAAGGGFEGSFAGVLEDLQRRGVFNARSAIWAGETEAQNRLYEARVAKREGTLQLITAVIGSGSTLAGGMAQRVQNQRQAAARLSLRKLGRG